MTAPIPARSRVLREAPVWNRHDGRMTLIFDGEVELGNVTSAGRGCWWANVPGGASCLPTREAAMAAVEAAVLEPDNGWQPIETAPKDGTQIVLIGRYPDGKTWSDQYQSWWLNGIWERRFHRIDVVPPTHWRPLPAPPEDKA